MSVILSLADVRLFGSNATEPISVDLVSPDDAPPAPDITASPETTLAGQPEATPPPPGTRAAQPEKSPAAGPLAQQPASRTTDQMASIAADRSTAAQSAATPPAPQPPQPDASVAQPEPDLSVKYPVMFGLPIGGDFDARADSAARIGADSMAAFRRHLASCSALPPGIARNDKLRIVIRIKMAPDGTLVAPPTLIEASASAKGPALMQAAIDAVTKCQPYAMLPADTYNEWKILDLGFTPQDLAAR